MYNLTQRRELISLLPDKTKPVAVWLCYKELNVRQKGSHYAPCELFFFTQQSVSFL